jgi:hypothetical protein
VKQHRRQQIPRPDVVRARAEALSGDTVGSTLSSNAAKGKARLEWPIA